MKINELGVRNVTNEYGNDREGSFAMDEVHGSCDQSRPVNVSVVPPVPAGSHSGPSRMAFPGQSERAEPAARKLSISSSLVPSPMA